MITLVLGGTRSGKSEVAEGIANRSPGPHTYIATGIATDEDMARRIAVHRARRPPAWTTVEAADGLVAALAAHRGGTALVDSLGSWVASQPRFEVDEAGLVAAVAARVGDTVVVAEEVGWSVHEPTEPGRRFVDAMGNLNRAVAVVADDVLLVVAGRALHLPRVQQ